jgi:hypothetical protein
MSENGWATDPRSIGVVGADGSGLRQVIQTPSHDQRPAWSPAASEERR